MTPSDAARVLGISADTVRTLADSGKLPTLRTVGGRRLFKRGDVEKLSIERARDAAPAHRARPAAASTGEGQRAAVQRPKHQKAARAPEKNSAPKSPAPTTKSRSGA